MAIPVLVKQGSFDKSAIDDLLALLRAVNPLFGTPTAITASGAIDPTSPGYYQITKAGVAAMTLAAPTAGGPGVGDDGEIMVIQSTTAFAHTVTATGLLNTGSASVNLATFAAFAGAQVTLQAFAGKWNVISSVGVTFS